MAAQSVYSSENDEGTVEETEPLSPIKKEDNMDE